ncbi:MAG: alpha/beta hydrolase [Candidatus Omnitrophica bacterium]|nr:alpha/beta hydrolase [Candidatus Omnitrophota bacterium]
MKRNRVIIMQFFVSIIIFILLAIFYVRFVEEKAVFYPSKFLEATPRMAGLDFEDIYFKTQDGLTLNGWFIKFSSTAPTVIFFHGNAGNISHRIEKISLLRNVRVNIFLIDYRGYGNSQGRPSEKGVYEDAAAAYDYLLTRNDIDLHKLMAYGESLGGAVAIDLATRRNLSGLIVDSSFTNAADMAKMVVPAIPGFLIRTKMDSLSKVGKINIPKLFIHSKEDEIVPFVYGRRLFEAAVEPKQFLETRGDHNGGYYQSREKFLEGITNFLKTNRLL